MKKIILLIISITFLFTACKKQETQKSNYFEYDGNDYVINQAALIYAGQIKPYIYDHTYYLILASDNLEISIDSTNIPKINGGIGNYLIIKIIYKDAGGLEIGPYFSYPENDRKIVTVNGGAELNTETGVGIKIILNEDDEGYMHINRDKTNYTIKLELNTSAEKTLIGEFNGELETLNP